ncbi:MAG: tRNA (guanine(46)-N(7))-methyltransferase TrmB [Chlamydiales bacterium]|nr:tRNA (guanine(46)-N(7))-methyltransferase TrmB [Chlamydiales bacterium]
MFCTSTTGNPMLAKGKDLKYPFSWEERRPTIHNRVLFVPKHYDQHSDWKFPNWHEPELFGREGRVFIEFCSGNGAWIAQKARVQSEDHWVAVEQKFERVRKIWAKGVLLPNPNLFVICGEALTFSSNYLLSQSVDGTFINFPDPWPKAKHAKNRLIQPPFAQELARIIKTGGDAVFATDDQPYAMQIREVMLQNSAFTSNFPEPYYSHEWPDYGASYFDSLWRSKGRVIYYLSFKRGA